MAKILIIGAGGREDALARNILQSKWVDKVYVAPGNGGIFTEDGRIESIPIRPTWIKQLLKFAKKQKIDLTVVGTEKALAVGIVDDFRREGLPIFGPSLCAAQTETSKIFAKELMEKTGIPTAPYHSFDNHAAAYQHIVSGQCIFPVVIKLDRIAEGKGVQVCNNATEAIEFIEKAPRGPLLIEDFLDGPELSVHALCDGKGEHSVLLPLSRDYKTIFKKGGGPNTGGMGSYAPVGTVGNKGLLGYLQRKIIDPTLKGLADKDCSFTGCLYPGLKITPDGIVVLEFNARFGDPEFQSYARILKSDLFEVLMACVEGRLSEIKIEWEKKYAVCVVLVSKGYPGEYVTGHPILGIEEAEKVPEVVVFHAGTKYENGYFFTAGGRVLNVTATGRTLQEARERAYQAVSLIGFKGMQFRSDIAES